MKKIKFQIRKGTKQMILGLSLLGFLGLSAVTHKAGKVTMALVPFSVVAAMKKKGATITAEEEEDYKNLDFAFSEFAKGFMSGEDHEALKTKFADFATKLEELKAATTDAVKLKELNDTVDKLALGFDQLKTLGNPAVPGKGKSLKEQIKEQLSKEENKVILAKMKNGEAGNHSFKFEVKASDMSLTGTTAYTTAGTAIAIAQPEFVPGLNNVARNKPFIFPLLNVKPTGSENIVYVEKYAPSGSASWIGEGAAAGKVSFDMQISNSRAKMVAAYIHVSSQMLDDIDYIAGAIQDELLYQVAISVDTFLLQGDGSGDNLKGIKAFAPPYTLTSLKTTNPNNCDAILAAATQIVVDNFSPDIAVMNPIDFAQTKLLKGTTGYYIVNPNNNDSTWANIRVVQSNQVPQGYIMVMDSSKTNVHPYQDFMLSYGMINDDFIKNLVVIKGVQRLHSFIKVNDVNAFVYDTLANILMGITAV